MLARLLLAVLALSGGATAFAPAANRAMSRKSVLSMSHFSNVKTELRWVQGEKKGSCYSL